MTLANSAAAGTFIFGLPNSFDAVTDEHGWTTIPFGLWPHTEGYQRFGQKEAEAVVTAFKSGWDRFKRMIVGLPVFKGHPDNPAFANLYPDKTEYGSVADMEVRDNGLAIKHVVNSKGATLVANGLDRISPNWLVDDTGEKKNGRPVYVVTSIKSIGLVNKPNIPNLSLANIAPDSPMKDLLIKLLALANDATDEQIVAGVTALAARPTPDSLVNAKNELAVANGKVESLTVELKGEKARADLGAKALANAKEVRVNAIVATAIKAGKITPADKDTWTGILNADVDAGEKVLANVKAAIKTKPQVDSKTAAEADRRARAEFANGEGSDEGADGNATQVSNAQRISKLHNSEMASMRAAGCKQTGNSLYNKAWANIKSKHPNLFTDGAKTKPEADENAQDDQGKE